MRFAIRLLSLFALVLLMQCGEVADVCEDVVCDDQNDCTEDACDPADGACVFTALADDTACSVDRQAGRCIEGACVAWCEGVDCDDGNDCTDDVCEPADGSCSHPTVQDGSDCPFGENPGRCASGVCVSLCEGVDCDDENDCTEDLCDRATGKCTHPHRPDGAKCDFGVLPGVCESGVCVDAELCRDVDCSDGNDCTDDVCDPTDASCSNPNKVDGVACEVDELPGECAEGVCIGLCEGVDCEDDNSCTMGTCDAMTGTCLHTPVENGTECDFGGGPGVCQTGVCVSVCELEPCDDENPCTEDTCHIVDGSCTHELVADHTACDFEGVAGVCEAGECVKKRSWRTPEFFAGAHLEEAAFDAKGRAFVVWVVDSDYVCRPGDFTVELHCVWANRFVPGLGWENATELGCDAPVCCYHCGSNLLGIDVAADPAGNAFCSWTSTSHLSSSTFARRFTPSEGWGEYDHVLRIDAHTYTWARIAADGEGNAIAVHGHFDSIVANQYQVTSGWGEQEDIEALNASEPAYVAVGANGDGLAYWHTAEATHPIFPLDGLVAAPYPVGHGWGEPEAISGPGAGLSKIVIDPRGRAIAMWAQIDGLDVGVWSNQYTREAGWGVPQLVQSNATFHDLAINASGVAVAVWTKSDAIQETVWSSRYTPGIGWDVADQVAVGFSGEVRSPKVGIDDQGNAIALWEQGGYHHSLWSNRYTPSSGWGEPELVSAESKGFALGVDPDGDATAVWASASGRPGTWANRYE